jgi:hypothetical protein
MFGFIRRLVARPPDMVIGPTDNPYMFRWWIIRNKRWFSIYLHKFLRDDDARAMHDHPWASASIILRGSYFEIVPRYPADWPQRREVDYRFRSAWRIRRRAADDVHRIELWKDGATGKPIPCWSLFLTGPVVRDWGFWCPQGWRSSRDYLAMRAGGNERGRGCD